MRRAPVLAWLALLVGCAGHAAPPLATAAPPPMVRWMPLAVPELGFAVDMPGAPERAQRVTDRSTATNYSVSLDQGTGAFVVSVITFPRPIDDTEGVTILHAARDALTTLDGAQVGGESEETIDGVLVHEMVIGIHAESPDATFMFVRLAFYDGALHQFYAAMSDAFGQAHPDDLTRFFDSVRFLRVAR